MLRLVPKKLVQELDEEYFFMPRIYNNAFIVWVFVYQLAKLKDYIQNQEYATIAITWGYMAVMVLLYFVKVKPGWTRMMELAKIELLYIRSLVVILP